MTDAADPNHPPSDAAGRPDASTRSAPGADGSAAPPTSRSAPSFRASFSTLISGLITLGALGLARAVIIGPDADRAARLLLLLGAVGVPFSLLAVLGARSAGRQHKDDPEAFVAAVALTVGAAFAGGVGLSLLLGPASDADYRVPLWQIETEPVVTLVVGLAAVVLVLGSRGRSAASAEGGAENESVAGRRVTAVVGACVAMPLVRRLLGRAGDEGLTLGWTLVLIAFDLVSLSVVAWVAYRGFGIGRDLPAQYRAARAERSDEAATSVSESPASPESPADPA